MKMPSPYFSCFLAVALGGLALAIGASAGEDKMQMMDTNNDGMISAAEHAAGARLRFQQMDSDRDGRVTATEMDAMHARKQSVHHSGPTMSSAEKIKSIDTDHDGAITAVEHEAGSRAMFDKMDTDGDGNVSAAEMQAGHAAMKGDSQN